MKEITPYSADERLAVEALKRVAFPAASWDKRFVRGLTDAGMTDKQRPQLWRLFIRYRRQISTYNKSLLMKTAERLAAPDLRKAQAAANEKARIDQMRANQELAQERGEKAARSDEGPTDSTEAWFEQEMHKEDDAAEKEELS